MSHYYVGDPCYIIPDEDWGEFCRKLFATPEFEKGGHCDGSFDWEGQKLIIWSNGGDGTWTFDGVKTTNGAKSFGVDAGIFCVIDLDKLPNAPRMEANRVGMLFDKKPDLYVEDNVVYINGIHDNSVKKCEGCNEMINTNDEEWCENGGCIGCWMCFECECEEEE